MEKEEEAMVVGRAGEARAVEGKAVEGEAVGSRAVARVVARAVVARVVGLWEVVMEVELRERVVACWAVETAAV